MGKDEERTKKEVSSLPLSLRYVPQNSEFVAAESNCGGVFCRVLKFDDQRRLARG